MRIKILILGLICFFIFAYCTSPADPKIKKALNDPVASLILPTIVSFTSSNPDRDRYITISWEVKNATSIWLQFPKSPLQRDVSHMPIGSVNHDVYGKSREDAVRMTYALAASNDDGSVREEIEVVSASATLEFTAIPEVVPQGSSFDFFVTETYGVGGDAIIRFYQDHTGGSYYAEQRKTFLPFETWYLGRDISVSFTYFWVIVSVDDDNGFWTEPSFMVFLRGPN